MSFLMGCRGFAGLVVSVLLLINGPTVLARDYYFSPGGSDETGDGTRSRPWATLDKANTLDLEPGDRLLFQGGRSFHGALELDQADAGTPTEPVVVTSYGNRRAKIRPGDETGIYVHNAGGIVISDLTVIGSGLSTNVGDGINFYNDLEGDVRLAYLRIERVEVTGFGANGLVIGSWNKLSGWRDVRITHSVFHDNRDGMATYAEMKNALEEVYVGDSRFYNNHGAAGMTRPTGNGLVLGHVNGALVERCLAYNNGRLNTHSAGPVGIWAYESNAVVIQYNESYDNRSAGGDGGGFDLDGGVTNSVLQYNYSHGNRGAGFGVFQYPGASPGGGNTIRFNVSQNDQWGGIGFWDGSRGRLDGVDVYHNTIYNDAGPAVRAISPVRNVRLRSNVFVTTGGKPLVEIRDPEDVAGFTFQGNAYWTSGAAFSLDWGGLTPAGLSDWRAATGQEQHEGGDTGLEIDPRLTAPGGGGTLADPALLGTLGAYRLQADSPLIGAGLDLTGLFGLDPGAQDYYGHALPAPSGPGIGAHVPAAAGPVEAPAAFAEAGGLVVAEAEHFHAVIDRGGYAWTEQFMAESVGAALQVVAGSSRSSDAGIPGLGPELQYRIHFTTPGTYYVWGRARAATYTDDSFHAGLDGGTTGARSIQLTRRNTWVWANTLLGNKGRAVLEVIEPGEHVLNVWMREAGLYLDRLLLTTEGAFTPNGEGPPESARWDEAAAAGKAGPEAPDGFALEPAYPNPFNPRTLLHYTLPDAAQVTLAVYDVWGRRVALLVQGRQPAGRHAVAFEGGHLGSGTYFAELRAGSFRRVQRIFLLK